MFYLSVSWQSELNDDNLAQDNFSESIRRFNVANDKLASTFRLLQVKGLPTWANTSSVSIGDVIQVIVHHLEKLKLIFVGIIKSSDRNVSILNCMFLGSSKT